MLNAVVTALDPGPLGSGPLAGLRFGIKDNIGSYETIPRQIDEVSTMNGVKGMMFTFDDFEKGVHDFGEKVMPLVG